jgi:hypothetical protein
MNDPSALAYAPGTCNIGAAEVAMRRRGAIAGALATATATALVLLPGVPREARLLVALPAAGTVVSALQVRNRFCVAFATRGVYNVEDAAGRVTPVETSAARRADRLRAARMIAAGVVAGAAVAAVLYLLP